MHYRYATAKILGTFNIRLRGMIGLIEMKSINHPYSIARKNHLNRYKMFN